MLTALNLCLWFPYRSFLCGGSTGLFIYAYCLYYYYARSDMSGFMQTSFFFGYMACVCYGFFLMLGTVGFRAALLFVHHIYRSIKCEQLDILSLQESPRAVTVTSFHRHCVEDYIDSVVLMYKGKLTVGLSFQRSMLDPNTIVLPSL